MDENKQIGDDDGKEKCPKDEFCVDETPKLKKRRSNQQENEATKNIRANFQPPPMPFYYPPWAYPPPMAPMNNFGFPAAANWSSMPAAPPPSPMHPSPYFWGNTATAAYANPHLLAFSSQQHSGKLQMDLSETDSNGQTSPPLLEKEITQNVLETGDGESKGNSPSPILSDERIVMREDGTTMMDLSDKPCSSQSLSNAGKKSENAIDDDIVILGCKIAKMPKTPQAPFGMTSYWSCGGYSPYFHPFACQYPPPYFHIPPNANFHSSMGNLNISTSKGKNISKNVKKEIENKEIIQLMGENEEEITQPKIGIKVKQEMGEENQKEDGKMEQIMEPKIVKQEQEANDQNKVGKVIVKKEEGICSICGDLAKTKHYGVMACEGCKGFFFRFIKLEIDKRSGFKCVSGKQNCKMSRETRNFCQFCRFKGCLDAGMNKEAVLERISKIAEGKKKENSKVKSKIGKEEANKLVELLNIICKSFKNLQLHRRPATLTTLSELNGKIDAFLKAIFDGKKLEIGKDEQKMLKEKGMEAFLVIRHVFLDDLPILKEFLASKNGNFDYGENEQKLLELLMKKVDKFRYRLSVEVYQPEEQAILSALAFFHHKNGNFIDGIGGNIFGELMNCLHTQMTIRDPNRFNHKAYNTLCRNLEELMTN